MKKLLYESALWCVVATVVFLILMQPQLLSAGCHTDICGTGYGRVLATSHGVTAYSNGECTATEDGCYQCVEYVKRFYQTIFQFSIGRIVVAKNLYDLAEGFGLYAYLNGGEEPPQVCDILCYDAKIGKPDSAGHVSVITSVNLDTGGVDIIEQNWSRTSATNKGDPLSLSVDADFHAYTMPNRGEYPIHYKR